MNTIKQYLRECWFGRLYQKSKWLFSFAILFFSGTLFFNYIQLETTPFFVWDMYKNPLPDKKDYTIYLIQYNDSITLHFDETWKEPRKIYLTGPLFYYWIYRQRNNSEETGEHLKEWAAKHPAFKWIVPSQLNSIEKFNAFPNWYKRFLSSIVREEIRTVNLLQKQVRFKDDGSLEELSSDTIRLIQ